MTSDTQSSPDISDEFVPHAMVERLLFPLAERFWPELETMSLQKRLVGAGEVLAFLYSTPLALAGLAWLVLVTEPKIFISSWPMLFGLGLLMFIFRKFSFFMIAEIRSGRYASSEGSLESMILWVALLLVGPTAVWLAVFWSTLDFIWRWDGSLPVVDRWTRARNYSIYLAVQTLASLGSITVYQHLGGQLPLPSLSPAHILPAFVAILVYFGILLFVWAGFIAYAAWVQWVLTGSKLMSPVVRFILFYLSTSNLAHPFGVLLAGVYSQNGLVTFSFFLLGMLFVAGMARRLSWAAENGRQKTRQLEKLELLSRAILAAPPDASTLPEILAEHVPLMFPSGKVYLWLNPDHVLAINPDDWEPDPGPVWKWLKEQHEVYSFLAREKLPWDEEHPDHNPLVVAPILGADSGDPIGCVYLELFSLAQPWDRSALENLYPAVQSLAAQVSSALHQAEVYSQALAYQKISQELSLAGKIQSSFLPDQLPRLSGWQLAVTLLPARETSGDFFDLIPLSGGRLGILVADVTDKGVGAALYMALSRTLIRTYAIEFDDAPQPEVILFAANNRILSDARADLFVTAFYGILDPDAGTLTYCNAGHNSPYLFRQGTDGEVEPLNPTGMPIGIEEDNVWTQETVELRQGDLLVMYTDGIPDSQDSKGEFFGDGGLVSAVARSEDRSAYGIQEAILHHVQGFVKEAPQFDDITLMVLVRD